VWFVCVCGLVVCGVVLVWLCVWCGCGLVVCVVWLYVWFGCMWFSCGLVMCGVVVCGVVVCVVWLCVWCLPLVALSSALRLALAFYKAICLKTYNYTCNSSGGITVLPFRDMTTNSSEV